MNFDLASQPQINYIKKLCSDWWKWDETDFFHKVNMNLSRQNLLKDEASDLIDELLKEKPDLQYLQTKLEKALKCKHDTKVDFIH